jgi:hypothetical protein
MKSNIANRRRPSRIELILVALCDMADHNISGLRTVFLIAGVWAAGAHRGRVADYLFATGLVLHIAIWFQAWWLARRER